MAVEVVAWTPPESLIIVAGVAVLVGLGVLIWLNRAHWRWLLAGGLAGVALAIGVELAAGDLTWVGVALIVVVAIALTSVVVARVVKALDIRQPLPDFTAFLSTVGVVLLAFVLILVVSAWTSNRDNTVRGLPAIPEVHLPAGGTYVALGDSYSAGEGLSPYVAPTADFAAGGNDCHESDSAYSERLHFQTADGQPVHLDFVACSGARIGNAFQFVQNPSSPRPDAPQVGDQTGSGSGSTTSSGYRFTGHERLVTLTMGGNDAHFADVLQFCVEHNCLTQPFGANPGPDEPASIRTPRPLAAWAASLFPTLSNELKALYTRLRTDAGPDARIVVVGYPQLFPDRDTAGGTSCTALLSRVTRPERELLRQLETTLDDDIYHAATAAGIEYVDPNGLWAGHEACGSKGQLIHAVPPSSSGFISRGAFHPTRQGQRLLAYTVACYLDQYPHPLNAHLPQGGRTGATQLEPAPGSAQNPLRCQTS